MCKRPARVSSPNFYLFESQGTSVEKSTLSENTSGRAKVQSRSNKNTGDISRFQDSWQIIERHESKIIRSEHSRYFLRPDDGHDAPRLRHTASRGKFYRPHLETPIFQTIE